MGWLIAYALLMAAVIGSMFWVRQMALVDLAAPGSIDGGPTVSHLPWTKAILW